MDNCHTFVAVENFVRCVRSFVFYFSPLHSLQILLVRWIELCAFLFLIVRRHTRTAYTMGMNSFYWRSGFASFYFLNKDKKKKKKSSSVTDRVMCYRHYSRWCCWSNIRYSQELFYCHWRCADGEMNYAERSNIEPRVCSAFSSHRPLKWVAIN